MSIISNQLPTPREVAGWDFPHATSGPIVKQWALAHYLAVLGVVFLTYQSIGWVGWIASGPVELVRYRDPHSLSWLVCRCYEVMTVITALAIGTFVIRGCLRERAISFDALFCLACASLYWQDPMADFFQPLFLWSQNWTNLNDWMGFLPFAPNPDAGRTAEPILQDGLNYLVAWLGFSMMLNAAMHRCQARFPAIKTVHLIGIAFVLGAGIDVALEAPMYYFQTWEFPGAPDVGFWGQSGLKFPAFEFISGAIMFSLVASIRYFRAPSGNKLVEAGLEGHPRRLRTAITALAMIGLFNIAYLMDNSVYWFLGTMSGPYKPMPAHIIGGACDAPGWSGTRYGACPGSPGYRMPLLGSLKGLRADDNPDWLNGPKQCDICDTVRVSAVPPKVSP